MEISDIKAHMKKYKITYAKLAEMTGINLTTIKRIFCGKTQTPHLETMVAIEQALGFINTNFQYACAMHDILTREERELLEGYRGLDDKLKKLVRDSIKVYSGDNELIFKPDKKV